MVRRILINAQNTEETRVAVINDKELVDFDSEVISKKPIKGNIYLAKVIRVEPSLQAVFIDYGGDRNGFLPFSEIHPDYYRIPADDLKRGELEEETEETAPEAQNASMAEEEDPEEKDLDLFAYPESVQTIPENMPQKRAYKGTKAAATEESPETTENITESATPSTQNSSTLDYREQKKRIRQRKSRYRVQEVIFPKQILLVQAIKDKRGKKCAAFSTYLSLAGQYCVLMPNAGERMGGVSKRIQEDDTRKRLRDVIKDLEIPSKMSMIIRTAGQERTKTEIKRDYEYLMRIWDDIRAKTLESNAPQLIHAEADILMRVVRDFYQKSVNEIVADTHESYKQVRAYMKKLSPSGVRKVKLYKDDGVSLFNAYDIESQIVAMVSPRVELPSGGSLVIGQTEALVAIDVNSGRATRERTLDTTALKTNLEAAKEIARQLRLRDLSGLIVIDFIDMADKRHIQQVEHFFQQELTLDRARVQTAPISPFGLLEMSRQRLRSSVMEVYSEICPHCQGRGRVYSTGYFVTTALHVLEKAILTESLATVCLLTPATIAHDLLNKHRGRLFELEQKHNCAITVQVDANLADTDFIIDKGQGTPALFSLEKADDDTTNDSDLEGVKTPPEAPTAAASMASVKTQEPTPPRGGPGKSQKSHMVRGGRNKAQLKKQVVAELSAAAEQAEPVMNVTYDAFEKDSKVISVEVEVNEPAVVNGSTRHSWPVRQRWRQDDFVEDSGAVRVSRAEHDWVDGEVRLLDTAEVVQISNASRLATTEKIPDENEKSTSSEKENIQKAPKRKKTQRKIQKKKNSPQVVSLQVSATPAPSEEVADSEINAYAVGQPFGQGALIVGRLVPEKDTVHSIKTQFINPDVWKNILKKKDHLDASSALEPSFTQAIKERLAGEDVLSPDGGEKKVKKAWLNELLSTRK